MSLSVVWTHPQQNPVGYRALCEFVSTRIWGQAEDIPQGSAMGVIRGGQVVAAVTYGNYHPDAGVIEINAAADTRRWLTRPVLYEMFGYPFNQLGCQAVVARIAPNDKNLGRIVTAYGFSKHTIPRLRGRNEAEVICVLGDDVWRGNGFHRENS